MTDAPPDNGAASTTPTPSESPVVHRSNYSPPPPGSEPPVFDDDALAEAMAEEVRLYTEPITLPKFGLIPPPPGAEFDLPPEQDSFPPATPPASTTSSVPDTPAPASVSWDGTPLATAWDAESASAQVAEVRPAAFEAAAVPAAGPEAEAPAAEVPTPAAVTPTDAVNEPAGAVSSPDDDELLRALGGTSTLDNIERLENELRLISNGEPPTVDLAQTPPAGTPVTSAEPSDGADRSADTAFTGQAPVGVLPYSETAPTIGAGDVTVPDADESAGVAAPPETASESEPTPALDYLAPGQIFAASHEPISARVEDDAPADAPGTEPTPEHEPERERAAAPDFAAAPEPDPLAWLTQPPPQLVTGPDEAQRAEPQPKPEPDPEPEPQPEPVAEQVTPAAADPAAEVPLRPLPGSEELSHLTRFAPPSPAAEPAVPNGPVVEGVAEAAADDPADPAAVDVGQASFGFAPVAPVPTFPSSAMLPEVDESLIDHAAAAELAAAAQSADLASAAPPRPDAAAPVADPSWSDPSEPIDGAWDLGAVEPSPEPSPDASAFGDLPGPGVPVPISTDPPVGPEAPDWLDAPPPVYSPPELVEPPSFVDSVAGQDPVAPITASTMAILPKPLPTNQPNLADRAELPPPPGYEDIPIMSDDVVVSSPILPTTPPYVPPLVAPPALTPPLVVVPPLEPAAEPTTELPAEPAAELPAEPPAESAAEPTAEPTDAVLAAEPTDAVLAAEPTDAVLAAEPPLAAPPVAAPLGPPPVGAPVMAPPQFAVPLVEATEPAILDDDDDDVIDEIDRVSGTGAIPVVGAGTIATLAPPSEPVAINRATDDQPAIVEDKRQLPSAIEVESAGEEPTALDRRAGRAARLFWLWFAANSSVLSMGLGAVLLATGMSLRQAIVATLAGIAISFLPLGLGTLAGKWSGQPTMIVSRATFGHLGNVLPALLAVVSRVLWGGVLLWLLATAVAQVLVGAHLDAGLGTTTWQLVGLVVGFVIATVIAVFGYGLVAKLQLVVTIVSGVLILGSAALTFQHLNFTRALTVPDGSWILVVSGAALVFSVVGLAWVHSSSDLARYQRPESSGGSSMLWATFGATLPPFLLIAWGAMLAASDPKLATALTSNPLAAIASLLPLWYPAPLLLAAGLGLLSGAVLTMYSGGFALQAVGLRIRRGFGTLISAILVFAAAAALIFVVTDFGALVTDLVVTIAIPVAAWAGIFAAEMMIRTRRFHTASLLSPGGLYPQVRWVNLVGLIVISVIGYGFVSSNIAGLGWEGFLFRAFGVASSDPVAASDAGVFVALLLGILVPLLGGIREIRRQERTALAG